MKYALQNEGLGGVLLGGDEAPIGWYLHSFDPDAFDGWGQAEWRENPNEALLFDDAGEALRFWRQQSRLIPIRPDGRPNRPLTAHSIQVAKIESI